MDEGGSGQLSRKIEPRDGLGRQRAAPHGGFRLVGERDGERNARGKVPIGAAVVAAGIEETSLFDRQVFRRGVERLRGSSGEKLARFRAGPPHRFAAVLDGIAAGGIAFVRRGRRRAGRDLDLVEPQPEFVRGDGGDGRHRSLAEFDLAGADRHLGGIGVDSDPSIEPRIGRDRRR